MKRIIILSVICLIVMIHSVNAEIFMEGPIWYDETCNPFALGDIKQISVSGNYVAVATECSCSFDLSSSCNGVFIFDIDVSDIANISTPFVYGTDGWVESVHVAEDRVAAGTSDNYIYYFKMDKYWQKKWGKNLGNTVGSVYVSGDYVAAGSGNYVYLFDAKGNKKWQYNTNSRINELSIIDNKIVAGTNNGNVYLFDAAGNLIKNYKTGDAVESIYAAEGIIAVGSDKVYVFDSGGALKWESATEGTIKSIHFADGVLAAGSLTNRVHIFDINGNKKATYAADSSIWSVHVAGDYISAGATDGTIHLITTDGELKWKYRVDRSGAIRSRGVSSVYNTEAHVYVGGWGKNLYLFDSGTVIADDEIKKAEELIDTISEVMDTTEAEKVLQDAKDEHAKHNYASAVELARGIQPMIVKYISEKIEEEERILDALTKTADIRKHGALANVIKEAGIELQEAKALLEVEEAKKLVVKQKYVESVKKADRTKGSVDKEIKAIIENVEKTVYEVAALDDEKLESILGEESEYSVMSHEEKEKELGLVNMEKIDAIDFTESVEYIKQANDAFENGDYENAIIYSEKAVKGIEDAIDEIIKDAENEINEVGETPLVFKVKVSCAEGEVCAMNDIGLAKERLKYSGCGVKTGCPAYSSAIFWAEHGRGTAHKDKTITIAKNLGVGIIVLFILFIIFQWYRGQKKEETGEEEEAETGEEKEETEEKS